MGSTATHSLVRLAATLAPAAALAASCAPTWAGQTER